MNISEFQTLLQPVTRLVADKQLDHNLTDELNHQFPPDGDAFAAIETACHEAIAAGWMCAQGAPGRRFGRIIEPSDQTGRLSVDVVELADIVGPHHRHPNGEVCMVMPVTAGARFDGNERGWCVYEAGSDHHPTVTDGQALVLYMLPEGCIEFT
jgi:hypothetical protein